MPEKFGGIGIRNLLFLNAALIDKWLQRFCPFSFTWGVLMGDCGQVIQRLGEICLWKSSERWKGLGFLRLRQGEYS